MKRFLPLILAAVIISAVILAGCGGGNTPPPPLVFTIDEGLVSATATNPITFPAGVNDFGTATVNYSYYIAQYEVTYALWLEVYDWAVAQGYHLDPGERGAGFNQTTSEKITFATGHESDPVTCVNWYDAVVWLNALTEYYNAQNQTRLECVYKDADGQAIRDASDAAARTYLNGLTDFNRSAKGFRLPTGAEWELAARFRGDDPTNAVSGYANPYFTKGDSASGATGPYTDVEATKEVAWYLSNTKVSSAPDIYSTQPVGQKPVAGNALGLYDLSGNVSEWCFDRDSGTNRMLRGGGWTDTADYLRLGYVICAPPANWYFSVGFRLARTK